MRHISLILLASLIWTELGLAGAWVQAGKKAPEPTAETVYVTRTGKRYHRAECRYLLSKIKTNIEEAKASGYTPCKVCKPARANGNAKAARSSDKDKKPRCKAIANNGAQCKQSASSNGYCRQHQ